MTTKLTTTSTELAKDLAAISARHTAIKPTTVSEGKTAKDFVRKHHPEAHAFRNHVGAWDVWVDSRDPNGKMLSGGSITAQKAWSEAAAGIKARMAYKAKAAKAAKNGDAVRDKSKREKQP